MTTERESATNKASAETGSKQSPRSNDNQAITMIEAESQVPAHSRTVNPKERPILFSAPMVRAILDGRKNQTRRILKNSKHVQILGKEGQGVLWDKCPYGQPGDRLWVRETWVDNGCGSHHENGHSRYETYIIYPADGARRTIPQSDEVFHARLDRAIAYQDAHCPENPTDENAPDYWDRYHKRQEWLTHQFRRHRPSIFMPRWASRITLEIVSVRVERLQDISNSDCAAEGIQTSNGAGLIDGDTCFHFPEGNGYSRIGWHAYKALWESINGKGSWAANPWVWAIEFRRIAPAIEAHPV